MQDSRSDPGVRDAGVRLRLRGCRVWGLFLLIALGTGPVAAQFGVIQRGGEPELTATALGAAVLDAEDARAATQQQLSALVDGARSTSPRVKTAAVRALGRLERRDAVSLILGYLGADETAVRAEAANAIAQSLRGEPLAVDVQGRHVEGALTALLMAGGSEKVPANMAVIARGLGRLPYEKAVQVERAETMLVGMLSLSKALSVTIKDPVADAATVMRGAALGLEMLARTQRANYRPDEATLKLLRGIATGDGGTIGSRAAMAQTRPVAFSALIALRGVDADTLKPNIDYDQSDDVRRMAMASLGGAGSPITGEDRAHYIRRGLEDSASQVRFEAVRAFARHQAKSDGCVPLTQMVNDRNEHVALAAIDALGDACAEDDDALQRLLGEVGSPPGVGSWRRQSHALVALAKRSKQHLEIPLLAHSSHVTWQVRMYAARAAAAADDVAALEKLALDDNDNVREATLIPLKRLKKDEAAPFFTAALSRSDYQLLRTAAREMAGMPASRAAADALADALLRVTKERRDTSRDTRVALLERLQEYGSDIYTERLRPLLKDYDRKVAEAAAAVIASWTGQGSVIDPQPLPREALPSAAELNIARQNVALLSLDSGREIFLSLDVDHAPMTAVRFMRLAKANYYNGLTFHRIVPNFIVQGGSPGANEYMGDAKYLRDEISSRSHDRGTVGLSTRGRDTGDAQFFINLVNNPRLDFDYTIFGAIVGESIDRIDDIQEGDRITSIAFVPRSRVR